MRKEISKKGKSSRMLDIYNLKDRVLQKTLLTLIEPYYDVLLHSEVFGFRRGRSQIHAAAELATLLRHGQRGKTIILVDIEKCFDNILPSKLKQIQVPAKFRELIDN